MTECRELTEVIYEVLYFIARAQLLDFTIRSFYLKQVRAYVGAFAADFNEKADLTALRFLSVNSIVDPWVFIIFRTSVFRKFLHRVCRRLNSKKATTPRLL